MIPFHPPPKQPIPFVAAVNPSAVTIKNYQSKEVVNINQDGTVTFGKGYTPKGAAAEFWKYVGEDFRNYKCNKCLEDYIKGHH